MVEDKKQGNSNKGRTIGQDSAIPVRRPVVEQVKKIEGSIGGKNIVTNTFKAPDPIKKK